MFEEKNIKVTYTGYKAAVGVFGEFIDIYFTDGKTARKKQFIENTCYSDLELDRAKEIINTYKTGDRIPAVKIGKGKHAGYIL